MRQITEPTTTAAAMAGLDNGQFVIVHLNDFGEDATADTLIVTEVDVFAADGSPAHIHFLVNAPGHEPLITHVFIEGDKYIDSDVVFGVKASLIREFERHEGGNAPDGRAMSGEWYSLEHDFRLAPAPGSG